MDSEKLPERLQEVSPERLSSHPLKKGNPRDHWRLEHVEQKVLESGLVALQSQLTASPSKSPAARQGSAVLRASFFERLLEGHVELKACPANDVAAAQGDLKKLNLSQLLALRILTKDFPTTSVGSLKVHGHFLAALSSELFQKVGARAMGEEIATRKRLEQIGLGAAELLAGANPAPPCCWLTALEEEDSSSSFVLVDVCAHSAQIMEGISGDFDQYRGVNIAVVIDLGSSSSLNWEVITMDAAKDDIPAAMTVLRARRRRKGTRRTTVEETPEDSARHFPSLPFATEELVPKSKREDRDAEASSTKGMEWPATSPPRNSREREGGYKDYPFITDIFDYFGCCTRRRDESHA